jgi:hypothetical protein
MAVFAAVARVNAEPLPSARALFRRLVLAPEA